MSAPGRLPPRTAWWRDPGPEACVRCHRSHHVEMAVWCAGCDGPICPACVVVVSVEGAAICERCAAEEAG